MHLLSEEDGERSKAIVGPRDKNNRNDRARRTVVADPNHGGLGRAAPERTCTIVVAHSKHCTGAVGEPRERCWDKK